MKFFDYCTYLSKIEQVSSRNEITIILADLITQLEHHEIAEALYMVLGRLTPDYISLEFAFSTKLALKSLEPLFGEQINISYASIGDLGESIFQLKNLQTSSAPSDLTVSQVHQILTDLAKIEGKGSQDTKSKNFYNLISSVSALEAKYIARIVLGKLRLGFNDKTILDALSWYRVSDKSLRAELDRAYGVQADIGKIATIVKNHQGDQLISALHNLLITPGVPVASKLVEREKSVGAVWERTSRCILQPKLDGLRAQIHFWVDGENPQCKIFSRNMEDMTNMFPDLVDYVKSNRGEIRSFVIDSEAIGFDLETGAYLPFQTTIQRKRKHGVEEKSAEIPIKSLAFDILHFDGEDISQTDIELRMTKLDELIQNLTPPDAQVLVEKLDTQIVESEIEMSDYFENQVANGLEGIIIKNYGTKYDPGTRNFDWIKLKASIKHDMVDTVDAIVLGYYRGTGARSKFGIGALLVGLYDPQTNRYKTLAKVGTGITDELFGIMKNDLDQIVIAHKPNNLDVARQLEPDVYVEPKIVVEIEADEITRSKSHTVCVDESSNGLSMRFPRLKLWNRTDKDIWTATSPDELLAMSGGV